MTLTSWVMLAIFGGSMLASSLHLLAASGHFPKEARTPEIGRGVGPLILYGTILFVSAATLTSAWLVVQAVPWYAAILGGGLAILTAPWLLPKFSDRFVDGRRGLLVFAAVALIAVGCLWLMSLR